MTTDFTGPCVETSKPVSGLTLLGCGHQGLHLLDSFSVSGLSEERQPRLLAPPQAPRWGCVVEVPVSVA